MIKILHTSDWHLGKKLFKTDRTEEFNFFLNWLIEETKNNEIDLVIIAGDIFDVPNPPHESVKMFYNFLSEVIRKTTSKIAFISGNHDSGLFIEAPSNLVDKDRIIISGQINENPNRHIFNLKIKNKSFCLTMLPYFRHHELIKWAKYYKLIENDIEFFNDDKLIIKIFEKLNSEIQNQDGIKILIAHHLFGSFIPSDSEYQLYLSGINTIPVDIFHSVNYMALGHIHKYQKVSTEKNAYYTGSPIAFRFSENNSKYLNIITVNDENIISIEKKNIETLVNLIILKTTQKTWEEELTLKLAQIGSEKKSYLEIQMEIDSPYSNLYSEIENKLKDTHVKLISFLPIFINFNENKNINIAEINNKNLIDHFKDFYNLKFPDEQIENEIIDEFKKLLNDSSEIQIQ